MFGSTSLLTTTRQYTILALVLLLYALSEVNCESDESDPDFNESNCDPGKNMELSLFGECICKPTHPVYSSTLELCLEPLKNATNHFCVSDEQCRDKDSLGLGPLAECNQVTQKCECLRSVATREVGGQCYYVKHLGQECLTNDPYGACNITIPNSICIQQAIDNISKDGATPPAEGAASELVCGCASGYVSAPPEHQECLLIASRIGDACRFHEQCISRLGPNHECVSRICQIQKKGGIKPGSSGVLTPITSPVTSANNSAAQDCISLSILMLTLFRLIVDV